MKLYVLPALLALSACASEADEFRLARLSDGSTEIALPYGTTAVALEASGMPYQMLVNARAKTLCPNGYSMDFRGVRQRPEYADPEKLWIVRCN